MPGARAALEAALALRPETGDLLAAGATLNNLAAVSSAQGDPAAAVDYYERALAVRRQIEDVAGQAHTLYNLGILCTDLDDLDRAEIALAEAVALDEQYDLPQISRDRKALLKIRSRQIHS
ncbi:MAG: tetratricopeptide repeat protein [Anaerolineae bacterium]